MSVDRQAYGDSSHRVDDDDRHSLRRLGVLIEAREVMRRIKLFSLIQERVARRICPSRWSARRRASWSASGGSAAVESLEPRCLLAAGDLDPSFGVGGKVATSFGDASFANSTAIQSDGKIVVA